MVNKGKKHEYLGMTLDFSTSEKLIVDMSYYVDKLVKDYPIITKKMSK